MWDVAPNIRAFVASMCTFGAYIWAIVAAMQK